MLFRIPGWVFDLMIALIVGGASLGHAVSSGTDLRLTLPVCTAATVAIFFRRRWPAQVLALETVATVPVTLVGAGSLVIAVPFAIYTFANRRPRSQALLATGAAFATIGVATLIENHWDSANLIAPFVAFAVAWAIGDSMHTRGREREERIKRATTEEALLAPSVTRRLLDQFARSLDARAPVELVQLTEREREVLLLVAEGLSNSEIAERLVVGESTVKTHVSAVLRKLQLRDRVQMVIAAYDAGLVKPSVSL
jgi:RNA polymerase sigma factor (sigma-70 family)